jgi:hypothetical protein
MTPDYGLMARGLRDFGVAALRTEARLLGRWLDLVSHCGSRFADGLDARAAVYGDRTAGALGAAGDAARDYMRGLASLPEVAMLDLAAELDAVRRASRGGSGT